MYKCQANFLHREKLMSETDNLNAAAKPLQFGISAEFPCGYLPAEQERILVYCDDTPLSPALYSALQERGFRRSEDQVYRPHCESCQQCLSIRVPIAKFKPSKSQKRLINKCRGFDIVYSNQIKDNYYPLFEKYINQRHHDGVMFPAEPSQLSSFAKCTWAKPYFIEVYDRGNLIAVAVGDDTHIALSAVYTFFDPDYDKFSLGTFLVIEQINLSKRLNRDWLYLGYYIKDCNKMNYKTNFKPFQVLQDNEWSEHTEL